ncbi:hypothetical protein [Streptomyces dysideae]|uniref:AG2 protein n=1 Tax=Streptomyces dysideae TaxID=909626 RepID=A0A101UPY3_9ACTN|nr:hypothetical protein [Streptomyces dysideae]KUO14724.1 hypothetical protein AQJ91_45325 [Streptomyces dysideae]
MIAYEQLYHLDVDGIKSAVDSWSEYIRRYDAMDEAYDAQVVKNFDQAGWTSLDGTALYARTQVVMANQEFTDAVTEGKGIRTVLQDAYDELRKYKNDLHQLTEDAKKDNITISATGEVSLTNPDPDGDKPFIPTGPLMPDGPSVNQLKVEFWAAKIAVVLAAADNADISASHALRRNTGKGGDEGFNDKTVKSVDQDESQRASRLLKKYEKGEKLSPAELNELERLMSHNEKDPEFSRMVVDSLGPETTLRLAQDLEASTSAGGGDTEKYRNIQNALANNIATANKDKEFSEQWRRDMAALGTKRPDGEPAGPYGYQTLSKLLQEGDTEGYPAHMVHGLTDDMIAAEKKNPDIWNISDSVYSGDDAEKKAVVDPVDNMLGIMSDHPRAATDYLDPKGGNDRLKYLLDDRDWPATEVSERSHKDELELDRHEEDATNSRTGFGLALEAATTGATPGDERIDFNGHTAAEARVMQATIERLDDYGKGGGDSTIPENMQKPLARALSDYTEDTHAIIAGDHKGYGNEQDGTKDAWTDENGRSHIGVQERSVIRVLRGVSDDPENFNQIYETERVYAAEVMGRASEEPGNANENWEVPARDVGTVMGAYNAIGSDVILDDRDERKQWADDAAKQRYHMGGMPLTLIPQVGDTAQRILDQATYDWSKDIKNEADAKANSQNAEDQAKGMAGTRDIIDAWARDRDYDEDDNAMRQVKQEAEQSYKTSRNSTHTILGHSS